MTKLFLSALALFVLAGGLLGLYPGGRPDRIVSSTFRPEQVLLSRITELAELVTLRVPVSTVITSEIAGYTGSVSCVIVVNGDVELGVDLEQARFEDVDPESRTATLVLPEPKTRAARLDHIRTHVYSLDRHGLWWCVVSDEPGRRVVNLGMTEAQNTIEAAARDAGLIGEARERAEQVLRSAFKAIGWEVSPQQTPLPRHE
jgi:hypothetical protein